MFERYLHTDELDAAMGVREAGTGYRDKWRTWLAGGGLRRRRVFCRPLKKRRLRGGRMAGPLL
jgi:hypothetical protein